MSLMRLSVNENDEIDGIMFEDGAAEELDEKIYLARALWKRAASPFSLANRKKYAFYQESVGDVDAFCQVAQTFDIIGSVLQSDIYLITELKTPDNSTFYEEFLKLLHSFFSTTCWYSGHDDAPNIMSSPLGLVCGKRDGGPRLLKVSADDILELLDFCENTGLQEEFYPPYYGIREDQDHFGLDDDDDDEHVESNEDADSSRYRELRAPLFVDDSEPDSGLDDPFEEDAEYDDEDGEDGEE
jgi:hypothetical protein